MANAREKQPFTDDVLTLHRDVLARVARNDSAQKSRDFLGTIGKAERMMAHLAGLNDALHGFSARAWALATTIVDSPTLCARLGTDARVLRLEELAELVQVVLEETESPDLHAWAPETGSQAPPRGAGTTAQRGPGSKSPGLRTEPARPGAARSRRA